MTDPDDLDGEDPPTDPFGLPLPLFVHREVPSNGRDLKVFVVGDDLWAIPQPFCARTPREEMGTPVAVPAGIRVAALACGRALGVELYGVDFLVAADQFFVVDVKAFPEYKGAVGAPRVLTDYLYRRALEGRKGCRW